jgi:chromosomal replication initiator protein
VVRDEKDVVSALRSALADEVGQERFELWFGSGVQLQLSGGTLTVSASDQLTLDYLRSRFRQELLTTAQRIYGDSVQLRFELLAACQAAARPPEPPRREPARVSAARTGSNRGGRRFASLDHFVVGVSNRVAYTAAQTSVERPGSVSPVFFYGPTGTGKTHLLEGIWSAARRRAERLQALYLSAEQFTSMFLEALRGSGLPSFRHKYRHVDVLLIDDAQFFLRKRATLVELQHTVDALLRQGKQLVLAADRSPAELAGFGPELAARLSGGLVCALEPPDVALRRGILEHLCARLDRSVPDDVLDLIASELHGDARQLAGALNQLEATSRAFDCSITEDMAQRTLVDLFRSTCRAVQLSDIERAVCNVFGLEPSTLHSPRQARTVSQPRALAMWLARKYTRSAYAEIGTFFGGRSHSTVISAQHRVKRWVQHGQLIQLPHGQCGVDDALRRVESQIRAG